MEVLALYFRDFKLRGKRMKDLNCRCLFLRVRPYNDLSKILDDFPSLVFAIFLLRDFEREI